MNKESITELIQTMELISDYLIAERYGIAQFTLGHVSGMLKNIILALDEIAEQKQEGNENGP